jgi:hypothetical protein
VLKTVTIERARKISEPPAGISVVADFGCAERERIGDASEVVIGTQVKSFVDTKEPFKLWFELPEGRIEVYRGWHKRR